jgi:hypothetical protein
MPDCTRHRVARRFLESSSQRTAGVVHVDPLGLRWGWFADPVQRLHLVPYDVEYRETARVWLEDLFGRRAFEIDRHPPSGSPVDLDGLRDSVTRTRDSIESAWLRKCSLLGWLDYFPDPATVLLYPGSRFGVRRELRETEVEPSELQVEPGVNIVYAGLQLNRVIWQGRDDGSDAAIYLFSTRDDSDS